LGRHLWDSPALHNCPDVLAGSTSENGQATPLKNVLYATVCEALILAQGNRFVGTANVDQVMANAPSLFLAGLIGAYVHTLIQEPGIGRDNLAPLSNRQRERKRGFSNGRRP
jgi:hypothetical protein